MWNFLIYAQSNNLFWQLNALSCNLKHMPEMQLNTLTSLLVFELKKYTQIKIIINQVYTTFQIYSYIFPCFIANFINFQCSYTNTLFKLGIRGYIVLLDFVKQYYFVICIFLQFVQNFSTKIIFNVYSFICFYAYNDTSNAGKRMYSGATKNNGKILCVFQYRIIKKNLLIYNFRYLIYIRTCISTCMQYESIHLFNQSVRSISFVYILGKS